VQVARLLLLTSQAEALMACFSFIGDRYNPVGLRSALGHLSLMA
jgi:hypothetical protein